MSLIFHEASPFPRENVEFKPQWIVSSICLNHFVFKNESKVYFPLVSGCRQCLNVFNGIKTQSLIWAEGRKDSFSRSVSWFFLFLDSIWTQSWLKKFRFIPVYSVKHEQKLQVFNLRWRKTQSESRKIFFLFIYVSVSDVLKLEFQCQRLIICFNLWKLHRNISHRFSDVKSLSSQIILLVQEFFPPVWRF